MSNHTKGFIRKTIDKFMDSLIDERLEADLYDKLGPTSNGSKGEIEFFRHSKGHTSLKIKLEQGIAVPTGEKVSMYINGEHYQDIDNTENISVIRFNSQHGDTIPDIKVNDAVEVKIKGKPFLKGIFEKD